MSETQALEGFDAFVESALKDWRVPACAVAVVQDGATLLARGYGFRDVKNHQPATAGTLFAIGSCTKAFTTMALGLLVDDGKLEWDKPVREYLPAFRLHDPVAGERMTPRDLVTHRSGLPRHDLIWYGTTYTRQSLFDRLRYLEPSKDLRTVWQYNNLMYMAAGVLIEHISGCTWEEFVRQRILDPLSMRQADFSVNAMQQTPDFARPYHEKDDEIIEVPYRNLDAIGPAGSINSSVDEMTAWLLLHLNKGKHMDKQLISEATLREMHLPQMVMPPGDPEDKEMGYMSYGLGWAMSTYRGHLFSSHGGGIDGFASLVTLLPNHNAGIVVLSNCDSTPLPSILTNNVMDRLLGMAPVDWNQRLKERVSKGKQAMKETEKQTAATHQNGQPPSHPLQDYAGTYEHPGYGPVTVRLESATTAGEHLVAAYGTLTSALKHVHYDTFEFVFGLFAPPQKLMFQLDLEGSVRAVSVPAEMGIDPIIFTRMGDPSLRDKAVLEKVVGEYEFMSTVMAVALKGENMLTLTVPGQPQYELVPFTGMRFTLKGMPGFSVEFKSEGDRVTALVFHQPNGVFAAARK